MNKITQFFKKYAFYISMGIVIVGALVAVVLLPKEGNVPPDSNIQNEQVDSNVSTEYEGETITVDDVMPSEEITENDVVTSENEAVQSEEVQAQDEALVNEGSNDVTTEEVAEATPEAATTEDADTQTFESTTVASIEEPFFADNDTFVNPVDGEIVVPYRDDSTKHWFSQSLNSTMRTYGVGITANDGEEVKAVAQGTVVEIIEDSSAVADLNMPYVGSVMILDIGNDYKVAYGFQKGTPDKTLLGKEVQAGDVLGIAGAPTAPFIEEGTNIYLQLTHGDEIINPENYIELAQNE